MQNIENYTLRLINEYWEMYVKYISDNDDKDIDYPGIKLKFK